MDPTHCEEVEAGGHGACAGGGSGGAELGSSGAGPGSAGAGPSDEGDPRGGGHGASAAVVFIVVFITGGAGRSGERARRASSLLLFSLPSLSWRGSGGFLGGFLPFSGGAFLPFSPLPFLLLARKNREGAASAPSRPHATGPTWGSGASVRLVSAPDGSSSGASPEPSQDRAARFSSAIRLPGWVPRTPVRMVLPSTSQFLVSLAYFPWSIKPIYGILSDCIPIKQRKRIPYLIISSCLSLLPWLILGLSQALRSSANMLTALLIVQNLGSAMADVVIDAMVAEAVRSAGPEFAGDLQSLSWSSMAIGGIFGSLLGGYALSNLPIHVIYVVFSALPFLQLVSCMFVDDSPKGFHSANDEHKYVDNQSALSAFSEKSSSEAHRYEGTRRRKGTRKNNKRRPLLKQTESNDKHNGSINSLPCLSLRSAFFSLCSAFKQPNILRPMAWFFFSNVTIPNISTVMFYYQTEDLNLEASFLGTARVIGWFSLMLGTYTYNRFFKQKKLRNILVFAHVGLALITLLDIVLVSRLHVQYGIADKYMVLWGSALGDAINQLKMMPFLILSGQLCPPGIEGTLFALFMSINNLGSTLGSFLGAALASALNLSTAQFDNLALGLGVQMFCTLLPIGFLSLIPKEVTGLTS